MKPFSVIVAGIFILMLVGCASVPKVPKVEYIKSTIAVLDESTPSEQKKGDIILKVTPLDISKELQDPMYMNKVTYHYIPTLSLAEGYVSKELSLNINFYYETTPFEVTIINNTDHILRMDNSRIVYIDPESDEPIVPYTYSKTSSQGYANMPYLDQTISSLPIYNSIVEYVKKTYKPIDEYHTLGISQALTKIREQTKFLNSYGREIMPGMKYSGRIILMMDPEKMSQGTLSFIDLVSKADTAGNPVEKVRFDYRVKPVTYYYKKDPAVSQAWTVITKEEYESGSIAP
ncbi:MAG: hypothetical protein PHH43_03370 [Candidatus Cloacimonetes bacterium]|nr:hypothetical protein [Candidatus Cloacimonadota bacterium]